MRPTAFLIWISISVGGLKRLNSNLIEIIQIVHVNDKWKQKKHTSWYLIQNSEQKKYRQQLIRRVNYRIGNLQIHWNNEIQVAK